MALVNLTPESEQSLYLKKGVYPATIDKCEHMPTKGDPNRFKIYWEITATDPETNGQKKLFVHESVESGSRSRNRQWAANLGCPDPANFDTDSVVGMAVMVDVDEEIQQDRRTKQSVTDNVVLNIMAQS